MIKIKKHAFLERMCYNETLDIMYVYHLTKYGANMVRKRGKFFFNEREELNTETKGIELWIIKTILFLFIFKQ